MLLEITHDTRYDYAAPVSLAHHLAHLRPLSDAHQRLVAFDLCIDPQPGYRHEGADAAGNLECHFSLAQPHTRLQVRATSRVQVEPRFAGLQAALSPPWQALAESLRYVAAAPFQPVLEFALPSPFVPQLPPLKRYAAPSFRPGRPVAEAAVELMHRVHADFSYQSRSTDIDTPLAEVWAHKRGVCQDFAHLMAGAMRMLGLPVRYVSGYLLTRAPEGGAALQGADASHAWVQVWCPGTPGVPAEGPSAGWLDLDPTNDVVPGSGHVRVAVGRDFGDVTPLRGVIRGGGRHTLEVAVRTRVLPAAGDAPERELPVMP
ncbi:MAG: transglutaminase [Leptothrix sp. (in: Bacteria)]|nr:transglutaminase [Leptothrix sp. (in: b-proteobacteria)]